MLIIEFKRVLKESIVIFLVLLGVCIAILTTEQDVYLAPVFEIFLLLYAAFTGWSIFDKERSEGAMEYLLSLPVTRVRLLFIKLLPPSVCVGLMLVFYLLLHSIFHFPTLLSPLDFSVFYVTFFLVSVSLSLTIKSFIGAFFLTGLLSGGLTLLNRLLSVSQSDSSIYLQANASLLAFPVLFFFMFHFYDVKPTPSFNLKFAGLGTGLLILIVGINYLLAGDGWCQYYLTGKGTIFKVSCGQSQLINEEHEVLYRFPGCEYPLLQTGNSLYAEKGKTHGVPESVDLLNLDTGERQILYRLPRDWFVMIESVERTGTIRGEKYYAFLGNIKEKKYRIVAISKTGTNGTREIPVTGDFKVDETKHAWFDVTLVYVTESGQFIINQADTLFHVDETGKARPLIPVESLAIWENRLLVFNNAGLTLYEITSQGDLKPLFTKEGKFRKALRRFGSIHTKKVIFRDMALQTYMVFSSEDLSCTQIPITDNPYFYLEKENRLILVWAGGDEISVGEIRDNRLFMKKEWETPIEIIGLRVVRVFDPGIVIFNRKEFETYWFD